MVRVLLYNIEGDKRMRLLLAARRCGLAAVVVPPERQTLPLGALLGAEGFEALPEGEGFSGEMLVMERLCSPFLDAIRAAGAPVALKAVVTEQNLAWSGARLYRELSAEHEAMQSFREKKRPPRHPKR